MHFEQSLPYFFAKLSTFYRVEIEKQLKEFDLHAGQIFVLFELWQADGSSQIELSKKLNLSPPTVNRMIKSLQKNRFIICSPNQSDGRIVNVFLTPKGVAIRPRIEEKWIAIEEKLIANLTPTEQLVLSQLFGKLLENLAP